MGTQSAWVRSQEPSCRKKQCEQAATQEQTYPFPTREATVRASIGKGEKIGWAIARNLWIDVSLHHWTRYGSGTACDFYCLPRERTMPYGMYLSAAGAHVQSHRLEVLSHNLANVNTPAFKPSLAILQARHNRSISEGEVSPGTGRLEDIGGGVRIQPSETQFGVGPMEATGGKTDFAINDPNSFFVVRRGEEQFLTRAGGFLFNASGVLTTPAGDTVLGSDGSPIQIDPSVPFQVHYDGSIQQEGSRAMLMVAKPPAMNELVREGANLFRSPQPVESVPPEERKVVAGYLEKSGVNPTAAMMELIEASRAYESNLRLIQHQDQAYGNLIGRVLRES